MMLTLLGFQRPLCDFEVWIGFTGLILSPAIQVFW